MENGNDNLARLVADLRRAVIAVELRRGRPSRKPRRAASSARDLGLSRSG